MLDQSHGLITWLALRTLAMDGARFPVDYWLKPVVSADGVPLSYKLGSQLARLS